MWRLLAQSRRSLRTMTFDRYCAIAKLVIAFLALFIDPIAMTKPMPLPMPPAVDLESYRVLSEPWIDSRDNRFDTASAVHPTATFGRGNRIAPFSVIGPDTVLGDNNAIASFAIVGAPAQSRHPAATLGVVVGDRTVVHSHATVSTGTERQTRIGDDVVIMAGGHVGHDAVLGRRVTLSNYAQLAGHVVLDHGVQVGAFGCVIQHLYLGSLAHVLPHQICRRSLVPGETLAEGGHGRVNSIGIRRIGGTAADVRAIRAKMRDRAAPIVITNLSPWLAAALSRWDAREV